MLLGVIADDFTGASDIANNLARGASGDAGLRVVQYLGVPVDKAASEVEAGVVALKSRSVEPHLAIQWSLEALDWLLAQGCEQIVFKYASTFDSTPQGNIGPVTEAIADRLGVKGVAVCPAFPRMGRTVYQGHLFVGDRLLNESGLEKHPLNPMTDSDIRRWLAAQSHRPVGAVGHATVRAGSNAIRIALMEGAEHGLGQLVVDAIDDNDLIDIATAVADQRFLTGGSGIAIGLAANLLARGGGRAGTEAGSVTGPEAILVGSCSGATRAQVERHARSHPTLAIDVEAVLSGRTTSRSLVEFMRAREGQSPLVYSSATPEEVGAIQARFGRDRVAHALDTLFAETARALVESGVKRLVVAGGETSGAVVSALDLGALAVGSEIDPGVPVLISRERGIGLALKSGNFGAPDFFSKALKRIEG